MKAGIILRVPVGTASCFVAAAPWARFAPSRRRQRPNLHSKKNPSLHPTRLRILLDKFVIIIFCNVEI